MRRRNFISFVGGAAATWPLSALAQQAKQRRVGVIMGFTEHDPQGERFVGAFRAALLELGWVEGKNLDLQVRWPGGDRAKAEMYTNELLSLRADVIVPSTNQVADVVRQLVKETPVVFALLGAPVESELVQSINQPGGNITGFSEDVETVAEKWIALQKEIAPDVTQAGFIYHPDAAPHRVLLRAAQRVAQTAKLEITPIAAHNRSQIETGIESFAAQPRGCLLVAVHAVTIANRDLIIKLAAKHRLPSVYGNRIFVDSGGLLSYGADGVSLFRGAATYVDLILKGKKAADLPVQMPTRFQLIVNLKTAKTLGLKVPAMLLGLADEVIE